MCILEVGMITEGWWRLFFWCDGDGGGGEMGGGGEGEGGGGAQIFISISMCMQWSRLPKDWVRGSDRCLCSSRLDVTLSFNSTSLAGALAGILLPSSSFFNSCLKMFLEFCEA